MPYIKRSDREVIGIRLDGLLNEIRGDAMSAWSPGDINYVITRIIVTWTAKQGSDYVAYNAAIGILECAKFELYRQVIAGYESGKKYDNGDVYEW